MDQYDKLFSTLLKYDFDLYKGEKDIVDFLKNHLESYYSDISKALKGENKLIGEDGIRFIDENLADLEDICKKIPKFIQMYIDGCLRDVYSESYDFLTLYYNYFLTETISGNKDFYRIRRGDHRIKPGMDCKKQKRELFHIAKDKRSKIGAYRYSIPGYPCLYLSTQCELTWFECGMPNEFSYCRFKLGNTKELSVVDFSERPADFIGTMISWLNSSVVTDVRNKQYEILKKYVMSYPFAAACSVKVKNRGSKFVEEYIFPQLVMSWVKESNDIDGIIYKSSLDNRLVRNFGAKNVALVAKHFRDDGLDEKLTEAFEISDIGYFNVGDFFKQYKRKLDTLKESKNKLLEYMLTEHNDINHYLSQIIEVIDNIICTYNAIMEEDYNNPKLIFSFIECLVDYKQFLFERMNEEIKKASENARKNDTIFDCASVEMIIKETQAHIGKILTKNYAFHFEFGSLVDFEYI